MGKEHGIIWDIDMKLILLYPLAIATESIGASELVNEKFAETKQIIVEIPSMNHS